MNDRNAKIAAIVGQSFRDVAAQLPPTTRFERLSDALHRRRQADLDVCSILKRDFPIHSRIHFEGAGSLVYPAVVLRHGGDRLKVRNLDTGGERWIYAERVRQ